MGAREAGTITGPFVLHWLTPDVFQIRCGREPGRNQGTPTNWRYGTVQLETTEEVQSRDTISYNILIMCEMGVLP